MSNTPQNSKEEKKTEVKADSKGSQIALSLQSGLFSPAMPRKSAVDEELTFSKYTWVVSVLNTNSSPLSWLDPNGHAMIVVEGIKDSQLFVGEYHIWDAFFAEQKNYINKQGIFGKVICYEKNDYRSASDEHRVIYKNCSHQSWSADPLQVDVMIESIKQDRDQCDKAMGYELCTMPTETKDEKPVPGKLYIKKMDNKLKYAVINPNGILVTDTILLDKLGRLKEAVSKSTDNNLVSSLIPFLRDLLFVTSNNGHTYPFPRYQYVGSTHILSDKDMGENCASWCAKQLNIALPGADIEINKPKQIDSSSYQVGSSCVML